MAFVENPQGHQPQQLTPSQERLLATMLKRQAKLSLSLTAIFILLLVGLPLANLYAKEAVSAKVGGFTLSWLILAVLFFPATWLISAVFVKKSEELEHKAAEEHRADDNSTSGGKR